MKKVFWTRVTLTTVILVSMGLFSFFKKSQTERPHPTKGTARITFLVSDGLYFGEGPMDIIFNDPLASPALTSGTELMQYVTEKAVDSPNR